MIGSPRAPRRLSSGSARVFLDRAAGALLGAILLSPLSCGGQPPAAGPLPVAIVARCGDEHVSASSLEAAAATRKAPPRDVLPALVADACLAAAARRRALPPVSALLVEQRAVLARLVLEDLKRAPHVAGPITDADVAAVRAARWFELDHDVAVKVVHAVVTFPEKGPRDLESTRKRAEVIRTAVLGATDEASFRARATAAAAGDPSVKIETLEPVLRDGRILGPSDERYEVGFSAAANDLGAPGNQSGLVESSFGVHVLQALSVVPAVHLETERLRGLVAREIRSKRARADLDGLLAGLRRDHPPMVSRETDDLLSRPTRSSGNPSP